MREGGGNTNTYCNTVPTSGAIYSAGWDRSTLPDCQNHLQTNSQSKYENNLKYNEDSLGSNVIVVPNGQYESHPLICQDQHFSLLGDIARYPEQISKYYMKLYDKNKFSRGGSEKGFLNFLDLLQFRSFIEVR